MPPKGQKSTSYQGQKSTSYQGQKSTSYQGQKSMPPKGQKSTSHQGKHSGENPPGTKPGAGKVIVLPPNHPTNSTSYADKVAGRKPGTPVVTEGSQPAPSSSFNPLLPQEDEQKPVHATDTVAGRDASPTEETKQQLGTLVVTEGNQPASSSSSNPLLPTENKQGLAPVTNDPDLDGFDIVYSDEVRREEEEEDIEKTFEHVGPEDYTVSTTLQTPHTTGSLDTGLHL